MVDDDTMPVSRTYTVEAQPYNAAAVYAVVLIMSKLFHLSVCEKDSRKKRHLAKCSIKIIGNVLK